MRSASRRWTPSARTTTLILALIGVLGHARLYQGLGDLESTFPRVPQSPVSLSGVAPAPPVLPKPLWGAWNGRRPAASSSGAANSSSITGTGTDASANLAVQSQSHASASSTATSKASLLTGPSRPQRASASTLAPTPTPSASTGASSSPSSVSAPAAWYNLLPHNAARPGVHNVPGEHKKHTGNDGQQLDEERESWEAARLVTKTLRIYALCSILASIIGAVGVLKSSLLATRIFVLSSFLDVFLYTLSLLSLLLLLTYPGIRSQVCELFASGSLQTSLGDGRIASGDQSAWWERIIEELFSGEECDEAFARDVVPMLLVFSLLYTALRFYFFFIVRHYYMQLWVIHQYLPSAGSSSSSGSSSSTPPPPCRSRSSSQSSSSLDDVPHCWSLFGAPPLNQPPTPANRTKAKMAQGWQEKIA